MKRKRLLTLVGSIALTLVLATLILPACTAEEAPAPAAPTAPAKVYEWKWQSVVGVEGTEYLMANDMAKEIEELSGGRLKITVHPAGAIVKGPDILDALAENTIQMGTTYGGYWKGFMPEGGIEAGVPMQYRSEEEYYNIMYGYGLADILKEAYAEHGVYHTALAANAPFGIWAKKAIRTLDDLQGVKIRAVGDIATALNNMGAAATYLPHEESYTALQLGTIDGYSTGIHCWKLFKHNEICQYLMVPPPAPCGTNSQGISLKALNELPEDLQALMKAMGPQIGYYNSWKAREAADFVLKTAHLYGGEVIQMDQEVVDAFAAEGVKILDEYAAKSARCATMVNIIKQYMKDKAYIE